MSSFTPPVCVSSSLLFPSLAAAPAGAAPVVPLGPAPLSVAPALARSMLSSQSPAGPPFFPSTPPAALSTVSAAQLAALFKSTPASTQMLMQHLLPSLVNSTHPLALPALTVAGKVAGEQAEHKQRQVVRVQAVNGEAQQHLPNGNGSALVISLKEDSERRRVWEKNVMAYLTAPVASSLDDPETASSSSSSRSMSSSADLNSESPADSSTDHSSASAPPTPLSADPEESASSSTSASTASSSSSPDHSPLLESAKHDILSPPAIGLLKEADGPSSMSAVGKLLLSSSESRFGLEDGLDDELGSLSPPAVYTPRRRGSFTVGGRNKVDEYEPLDALAYLHSLTSTPCSSASSRLLTPLGASTPSSAGQPLSAMTSMFSRPAMLHQPITAASTSVRAVLDEVIDRVPLRDMQVLHHYYEQQRPHAHRRASLYTMAASSSTSAVSEVAALWEVQQRTIAAKLHHSNTQQQQQPQDSDGDTAPIIVKQSEQYADVPSARSSSKRKRKRKPPVDSTNKQARVSSDRRKERSKNEAKENRPPQQCEQCRRQQANSDYGTGRFCGPTCARTFSIKKRSARNINKLQLRGSTRMPL